MEYTPICYNLCVFVCVFVCVCVSVILQNDYGKILRKFRTMYTVGYSLSLAALVLAMGILIYFR